MNLNNVYLFAIGEYVSDKLGEYKLEMYLNFSSSDT